MKRRIRMGMVGGGPGAFIGGVHRMAARLDNKIELVCGAFSSNAEKSKLMTDELFLDPDRVYGSYWEMFAAEAKLPVGERMDFVSIVTPNFAHFEVAKAALEHGFHVVCDKPMTMTVAEAKVLAALVDKTKLEFCLTHNYTGYPMVKQAKEMIAAGKLGSIRKVVSEYPQGWLATSLESQKQVWRTDPAKSGISCCIGDIGTHAENIAEYITGLKIAELCADLTSFVPGRTLDDDGNILVRFDNGARGVIYASQVSIGEENALNIRVYGDKGGLEWSQQEPNTLIVKWNDRPSEIYRTGWAGNGENAGRNTRTPAGHPEGFIEAFANLYSNFADVVAARIENVDPSKIRRDFPGVNDGVRGVAFIQNVVDSSDAHGWVKFTV